MMYLYGWKMEEHQPIGIDYKPIWNDDYIEDSMTWHYIEFNEDRLGELRFWDHTFPQTEFVFNSMARGLTGFPRTLKWIDVVEKSNNKYKATAEGKNKRNSLTKKI